MKQFLVALLLSALTAAAQSKPSTPQPTKAAIDAGATRFREGCAACHGADAEGGRGPSLVHNRDLRRFTDQKLFDTVQNGIPGTGMPPSHMPEEKAWQVVAFVRSLSGPASRIPVEGNAAHGRELFFAQSGCTACHAVLGRGGVLGPDLSDAGNRLTIGDLRKGIQHKPLPSGPVRGALLPGAGEGFTPVAIQLKTGATISGVAKNDSRYSIQVLDAEGQLHLLDKQDVANIDWRPAGQPATGHIPALSSSESADLLAFLAHQVTRPDNNAAETDPDNETPKVH